MIEEPCPNCQVITYVAKSIHSNAIMRFDLLSKMIYRAVIKSNKEPSEFVEQLQDRLYAPHHNTCVNRPDKRRRGQGDDVSKLPEGS